MIPLLPFQALSQEHWSMRDKDFGFFNHQGIQVFKNVSLIRAIHYLNVVMEW